MLVKNYSNKRLFSAQKPRMTRQLRREIILAAAIQLFAERGFCGTTTKDIASAAEISEASLFQYFKTKSDLYTAILENKTQRVYENGWLDEISEFAARGEDEKVFRAIAEKILNHCADDPNFMRLMLYTALENHENAPPFRGRLIYPIFELLRDYIETRKQAGFFQNCNAEAAAFAFIGTQIYYAMNNILFRSKMLTVSESEAIAGFVKLAVDGLRCNSSPDAISNFQTPNMIKDLQI